MEAKPIEHFVESVNLLLGDKELEATGNTVTVYLDAADVRFAVLGMYAFYSDAVFEENLFGQPSALVQALAASGYLGTFHLLAPHQAEFLSLIGMDFGLRHDRGVTDLAEKFWIDSGILKVDEFKGLSLRKMSNEDMALLIDNQVGNAARFFKAVEFIRGTWQTRLRHWRHTNVLTISAGNLGSTAIGGSDLFTELKARLDERRPNRRASNFADAVALESLIHQVDDFRAGRTRTFPCFYSPRPTFRDVIDRAGLSDRLTLTLPSGRTTTVLRNSDYFILRAIFLGSRDRPRHGKTFLPREVLEIIQRELADIVETHPLSGPELAAIGFNDTELGALVQKVQDLSFFESVWLPYHAQAETAQAIDEMHNAALIVTGAKVDSALEKAVHEVREQLQVNTESYKTLRTLWDEIPARYRELSQHMLRNSDTEHELFLRTGLLRFSFPQLVRRRIFDLMVELLRGEETTEAAAVRQLLGAFWRASADPSKGADAEMAAAILWTAQLDDYTLKLLKHPQRPHFSLDLVYVATTIRNGSQLAPGMQSLKSLDKRRRTSSGRERADIASGVAYLYDHLWHRSRQDKTTRSMIKRELKLNEGDVIRLAVDRAQEAYKLLEKVNDDAKRVYSINQIVYCMAVSGAYDPAEVTKAANELLRWAALGNVWQYRYDETLAQYYWFLAKTVKDAKEITNLLEMASERAKIARGKAPEDPEIVATDDQLRVALAMSREERLTKTKV